MIFQAFQLFLFRFVRRSEALEYISPYTLLLLVEFLKLPKARLGFEVQSWHECLELQKALFDTSGYKVVMK